MDMRNIKLLLPLALIALLGCHPNRHSTNLKFSIGHNSVAQTITIACTASSSGKCHFAFTGDVSPATADLQTSDTLVVHGVATGTQYCADVHKPSLDSCKKSPLPEHQSTESRSSQTDTLGN